MTHDDRQGGVAHRTGVVLAQIGPHSPLATTRTGPRPSWARVRPRSRCARHPDRNKGPLSRTAYLGWMQSQRLNRFHRHVREEWHGREPACSSVASANWYRPIDARRPGMCQSRRRRPDDHNSWPRRPSFHERVQLGPLNSGGTLISKRTRNSISVSTHLLSSITDTHEPAEQTTACGRNPL